MGNSPERRDPVTRRAGEILNEESQQNRSLVTRLTLKMVRSTKNRNIKIQDLTLIASNHIHLVMKDTGGRVIPQSMQLIAGRTAQELNERSSGDIATLREQAWCKLHQPEQPEK